MHSTRMKKKSGARRSGLSGASPDCPINPDTPGKFPDSPGFQNTSEKQHSLKIFNLPYIILRE
jgi:hypothetical protein